MRTGTLLTLFALGLALVLGMAEAASGIDIFNRVTLENGRQRLVFLRGRKRPTDPVGGIGIKQITSLVGASPRSFNTIFSPLFQVELRVPGDPVNSPPVLVPPPVLEFVLLPPEQIFLDQPQPDTARMIWAGIPVDGTPQAITMTLTCTLRPTDDKAVWNFNATITDGAYTIYAVRAPYLGFKEIAGNGSNDRFLLPMTAGQIVPDPLTNGNNFPERIPDEGMVQDSFFTYPGNMLSQFLAYYDPMAGFYLAAEDPGGTVKNLYFNKGAPGIAPEKERLYTYITHFNKGLKPSNGETEEEIAADLRSFHLAADTGYPVVSDVFVGDWIDAAAIYKNWVESNQIPFIRRGPLENRGDIDSTLSTTTYIVRWGLPVTPDEVDWEEQSQKIQDNLQFYDSVRRRYDPLDTIDFEPFVLLGGYHLTPTGPGTGGWDDEAYPLRDGIPELIDELRAPNRPGDIRVKAVSMNRDTTGISTTSPVVLEGLQKGIMRNPDLDPMLAKPVRYRSCVASEWLRAHRTGLIIQTLIDSKEGGRLGFNAVATTGTGNFSFIEYAPMVDEAEVVDRDAHNHTVGGGNYQTTGWLQLAALIKQQAAGQGTAPILLGMEHTPETMIEEFILVGRSFAAPLDDTLSGVSRVIDGAEPVPLFTSLYHSYNLHPSKPPMVTKAIEFYVDTDSPLSELLHIRLRYAQLAMHGRMLRAQVGQEDPNTLQYEGAIEDLVPELLDEQELFAALSTLRGSALEYLVYGDHLRPPGVVPQTPTDTVSLPFKLAGNTRVHVLPKIVSSAWRDNPNSTIGIFLVNYAPENATARFTFDPAEYGLAAGTNYILQERIDIDTWVNTGISINPTSTYASPFFTVQAMENLTDAPPWRVFRIIEGPTPP